MGKGALITAIAVVFSTMLMLFNLQERSNETDDRENATRSVEMARELALVGRKLALTRWVEGNGAVISSPFNGDTLTKGGGKIWIEPGGWNASSGGLDFTVRASYDSTVHEVRSKYSWNSDPFNSFQVETGDLNPIISPGAELVFNTIVLDDQSLIQLETMLVTELSLGTDLSDWGLGTAEQEALLQAQLDLNPASITIDVIDQADRDAMINQEGVFFPDQMSNAVAEFGAGHPSLTLTLPDVSSLGGTFGINDTNELLTIEGDLVLDADFQGKGILVVEGDLVVPAGVTFDWEGLILVKPPADDLNPQVDFSGVVNIVGSFVAIHEGMPEVGHMDLSVYRDMTGVWADPVGIDIEDQDILEHTHDYTALQGNYVVLHSDDVSQPNHESYTHFNETLGMVPFGDQIFFEIFNHTAHGNGLIKYDLTTGDLIAQTLAAGFDSVIADGGNEYRTQPVAVSELENFDIGIARLSALRKMWDTGNNYLGCAYSDGPRCVWHDYNRYGALTIRLYTTNLGIDKMVYAASLYWHKRTDEEEEFQDEMNEVITAIGSDDYGLDLNIGADTRIVGDLDALLSLGAFGSGFGSVSVNHLGTWHRQWNAHDDGNPLFADAN